MANRRDEQVLVTEDPTLDGLTVFAKGGSEREPIVMDQDPSIVDWMEIPSKIGFLGLRKTRRYKCGHRGPGAFKIRIYGRTLLPNPKKADRLCPDCSLEELKRESIRCCLCGSGIIPGEPVALYDAQSVVAKDYKFTVVDDHLAVGCMLWDCAPSGLFFVGHWNGSEIDWYQGT